jgi:hypothetical protein
LPVLHQLTPSEREQLTDAKRRYDLSLAAKSKAETVHAEDVTLLNAVIIGIRRRYASKLEQTDQLRFDTFDIVRMDDGVIPAPLPLGEGPTLEPDGDA